MTDNGKGPRIGLVSSTLNSPTTSDQFATNLDRDMAIKRFDVVTCPLIDGSRTHGIVAEIENPTEAENHLSNHISMDLGQLAGEPNSKLLHVNTAKVRVLSNSQGHDMPVPSGHVVHLSAASDIWEALGIETRVAENPGHMIPAGLLKQSDGTAARVLLDRLFLLGPEAAHVNVSGMSGLATKTSYLLFLIMAILQQEEQYPPARTATIIFNSKKDDLLRIHQQNPKLSATDLADWQQVGLQARPFSNVHYFLPRGKHGQPNAYHTPKGSTIYAFDVPSTAPYLDLLFSHVRETDSGTVASVLGEIREVVMNEEPDYHKMEDWKGILQFLQDSSKDWRSIKVSSLRMMRRHFRRIVETGSTGIFVDGLAETEHVPAACIKRLRPGDVYVFDIANLRDHERVLVVGSILQTIYNIKADSEQARYFPPDVILYLDELGKYAPAGEHTPTIDQFLEIAERGRSAGEILFCAEQSRSAVNQRIIGTIGTSIIGMTGSQELSTPGYQMIPQEIRTTIPRLQKGEMIILHPVFRFPIKIKFPLPAWKN